jgi:hypothetical protein
MKFPWTKKVITAIQSAITRGVVKLPEESESKKPQKRVLLVFPVFTSVLPEAFENFTRLLLNAARYCPEWKFDVMMKTRSSVTSAMNDAVAEMLKYDAYEYMISFDDDCIPELIDFAKNDPHRYQVIPRLLGLGALGHKIVMGVGYMKGYPHTITMARKYPWGISLVGDGDQNGLAPAYKGFYWFDNLESHKDEQDENGLIDVDWAGVPIMLVHRSVYEALKHPYFATTDGVNDMTHDVYFCREAQAAGFRIKVDTHIDCGHIIHAPVVNRASVADLRHLTDLKRAESQKIASAEVVGV